MPPRTKKKSGGKKTPGAAARKRSRAGSPPPAAPERKGDTGSDGNPFDAPAGRIDPAPAQGWPLKVQQRIRELRAKRVKTKSDLQDAVNRRDGLYEEIKNEGDVKSKRRMELTEEYFDTLDEIERCRKSIKWFADQVDRTIEQADQGQFEFNEDSIEPPPSLFEHKKPKAAKAEKPEGDAEGGDDEGEGESED